MALPQLLLIESLKLTVTGPQPSKAVAAPVALVVVAAPHSSVRLGGGVRMGGVVSRTVMVCSAFVLLPQASVAVQIREMTLAPPQLLLTESLKLMFTKLQLSCAVATPVALVPVSAGHSRVRFGGQVIAGLVVSRTVIVWTQLVVLPQASVAVQVRAIVRSEESR